MPTPLPALTSGIADRFWAKVQKDGPTTCWLWTGCRVAKGRGQFRIGTKRFQSPRIAYALATGVDPGGKLVCHSCDNPACCNPAHLWLGTDADNTHDMLRKDRGNKAAGVKHGMVKLTPAEVLYIRRSNASGVWLASQFGVVKSHISRIRLGKSWAHLAEAARG